MAFEVIDKSSELNDIRDPINDLKGKQFEKSSGYKKKLGAIIYEILTGNNHTVQQKSW